MLTYFGNISQASLGDLNVTLYHRDDDTVVKCKTKNVSEASLCRDIIDMMRNVHCKNICGVTGYYCKQNIDIITRNIVVNRIPMSAHNVFILVLIASFYTTLFFGGLKAAVQ